ncbi:L,D-transpeptidase family protein [Enterovirga aerilata]|uniref:L,D-transpeptidase n=1 Tax=Enterovirga aerilata TaxID=2730920 RepID=A0A849I2A3_9HYPH|nr:L,D-transpeptidase [Enterovirga sp. DB1703]NNM71491.1 L,D-transpeptidase [Enterovirga sp. DB1703]
MSDERSFPDLSRRRLLAGAAAWAALLEASAPAAAQYRRRELHDDPYYPSAEDDLWQGRYRAPPRDTFYDTQVQQDYHIHDPFGSGQAGSADPYGHYPYGQRRRAPADGRTGPVDTPVAGSAFDYRRIYGRITTEPYPVPAFNYARINPEYLRREVAYRGSEPPGTIVVDPRSRHLYFVQGSGQAIRYGVGVGRQGFSWSGVATVNSKQAWPDWYPPKEMIARDPKLARSLTELQSGIGMHGGPGNPLGARALYLWQGNKDTLYRIHGTTEPWTIGTSVSSGCIRMVNQDAIDLYNRAEIGAQVKVLG